MEKKKTNEAVLHNISSSPMLKRSMAERKIRLFGHILI